MSATLTTVGFSVAILGTAVPMAIATIAAPRMVAVLVMALPPATCAWSDAEYSPRGDWLALIHIKQRHHDGSALILQRGRQGGILPEASVYSARIPP